MDKDDVLRIEKDLKNRYKHFKPSNLHNFLASAFLKKHCDNLVEHYYDVEEESYEEYGISNNLDFNNWEELIESGNWGLKQENVDKYLLEIVGKLMSNEVFREEASNRIFVEKRWGYICYWTYVRDLFNVEYTFAYKRCFLIWLFWEIVWNIKTIPWMIENRDVMKKFKKHKN